MAVALDAVSNGNASGATSLTVSHTCTGSNLFLAVYVGNNYNYPTSTSVRASGVTYNSVAMTAGDTNGSNPVGGQWWFLAAPSSGTHNIVVTMPSTQNIALAAISLSGAKQTGQPHKAVRNSGYAGSGPTWTSSSITPTTDGCMILSGNSLDGGSSINSPFTEGSHDTLSALWVEAAYYLQTTAGAIDATWAVAFNTVEHNLVAIEPAAVANTTGLFFVM